MKKNTNKTKFLAILIAVSILLASIAFAEPKSLRYAQFYSSKSSLSGYATAIPPNTSITGNAIEVQPSSSSSPTFVVKESGYVGIGIPGPQSPLHVKTSAGQLKISEAGANSVALTVRNNAGDGYGSLALNASDYWWQTSGNTRMVLDDQGRLGLGTNSPAEALSVNNGNIGFSNGTGLVSTVGGGSLKTGTGGRTWWAQQGDKDAWIMGFKNYTGDVVAGFDPVGRLGVGTQTPQKTLHVLGQERIEGTDLNGGNGHAVLELQPNVEANLSAVNFRSAAVPNIAVGQILYEYKDAAGNQIDRMSFRTNSQQRVYIDKDGKVGIGTSAPGKQLHILEPDGKVLRLERTNAPTRQWDINIKPTGNFVIGDNTAFADRFAIDTNGNVGVGTNTPQAKLHIDAGATPGLRIESDDQGPWPFIIKNKKAPGAGLQVLQADDGRIEFWNDYSSTQGASNALISLKKDGNVGVGTSDPQRKLVVKESDGGTNTLVALYNPNTNNNNGAVLSFRGDTTGTGASSFVELAAIQGRFDEHENSARKSSLGFYTSNGNTATEKMRITGDGNLYLPNLNSAGASKGKFLCVDDSSATGGVPRVYIRNVACDQP